MTHFKTTLRTLTGCNDETAEYIESATQGRFEKLRNIDTSSLSDAQKRKVNSLIDAVYSVLRGEDYPKDKITGSSDVYTLMRPHLEGLAHEEVWVILMNQAGKVIQTKQVSTGGMTGAVVDPKVVLCLALESRATRMILVHNHPSGNARPSRQDIMLTTKIKQSAALLDLVLTDHLIYAGDMYFSFLDEGML